MQRAAGARSDHARDGDAPPAARRLQPAERFALTALGAILAVSAAWWAAALWPLPATTPDWVVRARAACFGVEHSGLPHAGGWILLVGSPLSLVAALGVIWGRALRRALELTYATMRGRLALGSAALAFVVVIGASAVRAAGAAGVIAGGDAAAPPPVVLRVLDQPPGELGLVSHRGESIDATRFGGAPLLVTFAFGRCETICPVIVEETLAARVAFGTSAPPLVIITVDPWRDVPSRLPHIAGQWRLDEHTHLLGGEVAAVERVLDSWRVERARDERTGDVVHPSLVYVLDGSGVIRYAVPGWREHVSAAIGAVR
jgi:protein SCO1